MRASKTLLAALVAASLAAACGGDDDAAPPAQVGDSTATTAIPDDGDGVDPIAGVDLSSLGPPPDAGPQTVVVRVDGETTTFDGAELTLGQCDIADDEIAVRIGQSGPWLSFAATNTGGTWSAGPSWQPAEDPPQYEGLTPGGEIVVDGDVATYRGEVVIKNDPTDFDSWTRTVGSVTVNCGER